MKYSHPIQASCRTISLGLWMGCLLLSTGCTNTGLKTSLFGSKSSLETGKTVAQNGQATKDKKQDSPQNGQMNSGQMNSGQIVENSVRDANLALSQKDNQQAKILFSKALLYRPDHPEANHGMAIIADQEGRFADAENYYSVALRAEPRNADILGNLGYSYYLQRKYPESETYLRKALTANPQHKKSAYHLAQVYASLNDYDRSLAMLRLSGTEAQAQSEIARLFPGRTPNSVPGMNGQNSQILQASQESPTNKTQQDQNPSDMTASLREKMDAERARGIQQRKARNMLNNPVFENQEVTGYNKQQAEAIRQGRVSDGMINDIFSKIDEQKSPVYLTSNPQTTQSLAGNSPANTQQLQAPGNPNQQMVNQWPTTPEMQLQNQQTTSQPAPVGNNLYQQALSAYAQQAKRNNPTFQGVDDATVVRILERDLKIMDQKTLVQQYPDLPVSLAMNRQAQAAEGLQSFQQFDQQGMIKSVSETQQFNPQMPMNQQPTMAAESGNKLPEIIRHQSPSQVAQKTDESARQPGMMIKMPNQQQVMDQEMGHRNINVNTANMTADPRWNIQDQNIMKEASAQKNQVMPANSMNRNPPVLNPSTMNGNDQYPLPPINVPDAQYPAYPGMNQIPDPSMQGGQIPAGRDYEEARQRAAEMGMGVGPGQLFPMMKSQQSQPRDQRQQPLGMPSNPNGNFGQTMNEPVMPPHPWSNQMPDLNIPAAKPLSNNTQSPALPAQYSQPAMMGTSSTFQTPPSTMGVNYYDMQTNHAGTVNNSNNLPLNDPYQHRMHQQGGGSPMNTSGNNLMNPNTKQELPQWPHAPAGSQADSYNNLRSQSTQEYQQNHHANQANPGLYSTHNNTTMNLRTISNQRTVNGIPDDQQKYNSAPVQPPQTAPSNWNILPTIQPN